MATICPIAPDRFIVKTEAHPLDITNALDEVPLLTGKDIIAIRANSSELIIVGKGPLTIRLSRPNVIVVGCAG